MLFRRGYNDVPVISMTWYQSSDLNYVLHWLILFCLTEFPDTTSITDHVENDTIKSLACSSIAYSACSSFAALSGNSDLHLHSTDKKTAVHWERWAREESVNEGSEENEDESDSDEEDEAEHREPMEHLLKVRQATVINISGHVCTGMIY